MIVMCCDGACSGNPGPGGWGVVIEWPSGEVTHASGFEAQTTNNRMELMAAIEGLAAVGVGEMVTVVTDSQYVQQGMMSWLSNWKRRGWRTASKGPVKNQDLWERLDALAGGRKVTWEWVRGHAGHPGNEQADRLAVEAIKRGA